MNTRMQIHKVGFQVLLVLPPRQPIHSRSSVPLEPGKRYSEQMYINMVE
jgi:hypothetical protein